MTMLSRRLDVPATPPPSAPAHESDLDTILTLPSFMGCRALAAACRDAALMFINESAHWGKAELALWLMGPYSQVMRFEAAYAERRGASSERSVPLLREIDARMVDRIISTAREEVLEALRMLPDSEGGATFAFCVISESFVARCEDSRHIVGWVPTNVARRLADRVLSLIAVDYLMNPEDYENDLFMCPACGSVSFEARAWERGRCAAHTQEEPRSGRPTLPYLPEGA